MPDLSIRIKKKNDGSAALSCIRANGTSTWQRQDGQLGAFFPLHDLTHYAVETTLGFRRAFYGLIAEGWELDFFAESGLSKRLPEDAVLAEVIVGFFDLERATGVRAAADDFNWKIQAFFTDKDLPSPTFHVTDDGLDRIRELSGELFRRWRELPPGQALELSFDRAALAV
jgi:hypothetical protein